MIRAMASKVRVRVTMTKAMASKATVRAAMAGRAMDRDLTAVVRSRPFGGGGSFLGTAAASAVGAIGGSLLMNSLRGMMGGGHRQAFGDTSAADRSASPWSGDQSNSSAARDLGVNDIGNATGRADDSQRAGLFDTASNDDNDRDDMDSDDGGDDNDNDYA